jgi:hypothetical protein
MKVLLAVDGSPHSDVAIESRAHGTPTSSSSDRTVTVEFATSYLARSRTVSLPTRPAPFSSRALARPSLRDAPE